MIPEKFNALDRSPESILAMNSICDLLQDLTNPISVVLTVNGQQASFREAVKIILCHYNQDVEDRATQLVKERTTEEIDKLISKLEKFKEAVNDTLQDIGFKNVNQESDYWHDA